MLGKILLFPVWLVQKGFGCIFGVIRIVFSLVFGIIRFLFSRSMGAVIGGLIGFFLGKNHVGIKIWKKK